MTDGVIIIDKAEGMSSQAVVNRVKRLLGVSKAGHTGTLDPMATGVLPVLVGRAVKASEFMLTQGKHYIATLKLGITTDTEDIWGSTLTRTDNIPAESEVMSVICRFVGEYMQTPPMYSALKVGGRKLCDLARAGIEIERAARPVTVYSLTPTRLADDEYALDVSCSKGTYIRTLCADIGKELGCGGVMKSLRRVSAAGHSVGSSITLDELESMSEQERMRRVLPTESIFADKRRVTLGGNEARLMHNGLALPADRLGVELREGELVRLCDGEGFFAVGEGVVDGGVLTVKPIRQFVL